MIRVVVEQYQRLHPCRPGGSDRRVPGAVSPSAPQALVFPGNVGGVVDQVVCTLRKADQSFVGGLVPMLVVGCENDAPVSMLEPIRQGPVGVPQRQAADPDVAVGQGQAIRVDVLHHCRDPGQVYRKVGGGNELLQDFLDRPPSRLESVQCDGALGVVEGLEEREPLDVVEVIVRQKDMEPARTPRFSLRQSISEESQTTAAIQNQVLVLGQGRG